MQIRRDAEPPPRNLLRQRTLVIRPDDTWTVSSQFGHPIPMDANSQEGADPSMAETILRPGFYDSCTPEFQTHIPLCPPTSDFAARLSFGQQPT
jgi:hypothetical protein